jgi:hypothetical protein
VVIPLYIGPSRASQRPRGCLIHVKMPHTEGARPPCRGTTGAAASMCSIFVKYRGPRKAPEEPIYSGIAIEQHRVCLSPDFVPPMPAGCKPQTNHPRTLSDFSERGADDAPPEDSGSDFARLTCSPKVSKSKLADMSSGHARTDSARLETRCPLV